MHQRLRALPLIVAAALLLAACGGDDSKAEQKEAKNATAAAQTTVAAAAGGSTAAGTATTAAQATSSAGTTSGAGASAGATRTAGGTPGANVLGLRCDNVRSYRFNGTLKLASTSTGGNNSAGGLGGLLENLDVKLTGAYQAPDRTQLKIELGGQGSPLAGQAIETVQIGNTSYVRVGSTPWQQNSGGPADVLGTFTPQELCESALAELPAAASSTKETVNGVATTRYTYTRAQLEELARELQDVTSTEALRDLQANIWVSEQEKFPVKVTMSTAGTASGQTGTLNVELNVTDLNGNISIEAPR